jgi:hypothetical protein
MKTRSYRDPVVEAYMAGVDRTLLRENLKLTPAQRLEKLVNLLKKAQKSTPFPDRTLKLKT